ncbi:LamG-like jellyroll fold domain-containing protein [Micromonospora chalcea]|uniref:LamG-like jellyroll fold domain-containing protein n=1 Tax=Micromonospora sp. TSRI0369 TaxID=1703936 RepID=UPI000A54BC39|nr:LamG-like jellyroll fold domain-containing protein [Micromonospora sp. TSRI0369]
MLRNVFIGVRKKVRGRRSASSWVRRIGVALTFTLALSVAVPPGAVPADGAFPLSWLWSWLPQRAAWSAPGLDGPAQKSAGGAAGRDHYASTAETTADGGAGGPAGHSPAANKVVQAKEPGVKRQTTPPIADGKGFDSAKSRRIADEAEANADLYQNPDGSVTRKLHELPINYRADDGAWRPIDRTLVRSGTRLKQKASPLGIDLAARADDPRLVTFRFAANRSISWSLEGAAAVAPVTADSAALYRSVLPETDLRVTTGPRGLKEEFVLHSPTAANSWVFPLTMKGLDATVEPDGSIALREASGKTIGSIPVGSMHDSFMQPGSGEFTISRAISYELIDVAGGRALRMTASREWLQDPNRVFPVTVDPSVTSGYDTTADTYMQYGDDVNHSGEDNLAVGTWDGGTHRSISLLAFQNFGTAFDYKNLSSVRLKLYLTWQYNCTAQEFSVQTLTQPWNASTARYGGIPYAGPGLGTTLAKLSPNSARACGNKGADRSIGDWVTVDLPVSTFQSWANGGANYGLALNTNQTNSPQFKRFTSRDGPNPVFTPYLELTYTDNVAPQVNSQYPSHGHTVNTLTPELMAYAVDPDAFPAALSFNFMLYDRSASKIAESGWQPYMSWFVPSGKLKWNEGYTWTVIVKDGNLASTSQKLQSFATAVQQPLTAGGVGQNGDRGFDPSTGNYTFASTDASVPTPGPPLTIARTYNTLSKRPGSFGQGWSSLLDMRIVDPWSSIKSPPPHLNVTYPSGEEVAFGRNADGSFAPPSGRFASLSQQPGGDYELVDKDGTTYTFRGGLTVPGQYDLVAVTDSNGRTLRLKWTYVDTEGRPTTITGANGRSLHLRWSTARGVYRLLSVSTDPVVPGVPDTASTWTYEYTDTRLTKVCPPTSVDKCTTYTYTASTRYPATLERANPRAYWRLGETSGTTAANSVLEAAGAESGTYNSVTLGQAGALAGSTAKAPGFNGTSSHVSLPVADIDQAGYKSVSLWFKMNAGSTAGGTLFAYQTNPITSGPTANFTPALYVGTDGKLRGEFWTGAVEPITSYSAVNDGRWHNATLVGDRTSQTLYLDGFPEGTLNKLLAAQANPAKYVYVGAGETNTWPARPTNSKGFFPGSIAEVALFDRALSRFEVSELESTNIEAAPISTVVRASGNRQTEVRYDGDSGRVNQVTDEHGGVWKIGAGTPAGSFRIHAGTVLGANPADYWRLAESGTTEAVNEVNGGVARYNSVTLGTPGGPFDDPSRADDNTAVAAFNGTSSYLRMPANDVPGAGPHSIAMWFRTPAGHTGGGVLFGSQVSPIDDGGTPASGWSPNLYVGTDGKLRGKFWNGNNTPITSAAAVNDGKWHHVVLAASDISQTLYLDGMAAGTIAGGLSSYGAVNAYVGAGRAVGWPAAPTNANGYYKGEIAEVSYYRGQLTAADAGTQFAARSNSSGALTKTYRVTDPSDKQLTYVYDVADRKIQETDALGRTTRFGYDAAGFLRSTTDPNGNVTTTEHDPRGNVVASTTCQDRSENRCSTVYYTYSVNSTPPSMWKDAGPILSPGDFDGDGAADVIYRNNSDKNIYLMRGNGRGGWLTSVPAKLGGNWGGPDQIIAPGDFDGDGNRDVIYHMAGENNFHLWRGNGKGWWASDTYKLIPSTFGATAQMVFSPGDFDGDGKRDILFRKSTDNNLYLVKGNGAGGWLTGTPIQVGTGWGSAQMIFSPGDFDGDGKPDVLYRKSTDNGLYIVKGNGAGGWLTGTSVLVSAGWTDVDALVSSGDFNGDGKADVLRRGSTDRDMYLMRGNGSGGWASGTAEKLGAGGPDPRNDVMLTMRDGRSTSGVSDDRYLTTFGYDGQGNRTTVRDPLGRTTVTSYTDGSTPAEGGGVVPAGLPATITSPAGVRQQLFYFPNGDLARTVDAVGKEVRYTYDGIGRITAKKEITESFPAGLETIYEYDRLGRVVTQTEPATTNRVTGAVHTPVTSTVYDDDGFVLSETVTDTTGGDASRTESATYNAFGQQETATDASGRTTRLEYDSYGRTIKEIGPDGGEILTTYDPAGQQLTTTLLGWTGDPNEPRPAQDLVLSSKEYDPAGRLATETDAMGWETRYTYTDNGLTASITRKDPSTGATFVVQKTEYDGAGNPITVITNGGASTTVNTVDAANRVTRTVLDPDGLKRYTNFEYSLDDQVVSAVRWDPEATRERRQMSYDPMGRQLSDTIYLGSNSPVGRWTFDGDADARLSDSTGNSPLSPNGPVEWGTDRGGLVDLAGATTLRAKSPVVDPARSFTVAAWVRASDTVGTKTAVSGPGQAGSAFELGLDGGRWKFAVRSADRNDGEVVTATAASTPQADTWTHLVGTFDAATGTIRLYVGGVLAGTTTGASSFSTRLPLRIGAGTTAGGPTGFWAGQLDDVQLYQRTLPDAEVAQVTAGTAPTATMSVVRTTYDVDNGGLVRATTDPTGATTDHQYDEAGRPAVTVGPAVSTETGGNPAVTARPVSYIGYDTFGEVAETKDANGNVTVNDYDGAGRIVATHLPSYTPPGSSTAVHPVTSNTYDELGQLKTQTDTRNKTTSYQYDQLGQVAMVTAPDGGTSRFTYNLAGDRLSTTDPTGARNEATYDFLGRTVTSTDIVRQTGSSHTTSYAYGAGGWLSSVTSPAGVTSTTTYNAAGESITQTDGAGKVTRYDYDSLGRSVRTTLPDGTYDTVGYDMASRSVSASSYREDGTRLRTRSWAYDRAGRPVRSTDARESTTSFAYDASGRLISQMEPISASDSITTSFGYDLAGNRTRLTDGRGNRFITTYNTWNLPESRIEPATSRFPDLADRTFTVAYERGGKVAEQRAPDGVTISNGYDEVGRLITQTGAGAEATSPDRSFGYDRAGRLTSVSGTSGSNTFTFDDRGLLSSAEGPSGASSFTWSPDRKLTTRTDAAGVTTYGYDPAGRPATVSNPTAGVSLSYTYNSLSQVATIGYGAGGNTRSLAYDDLHRLTGDTLSTSAGATVARIAYGYDANDNETSKTTTGFGGSTTNTYTYDLANRLTGWDNGSTPVVYAYDKSGNRVQAGTVVFNYDQRNQLTGSSTGATYRFTPRGTLASATTANGETITSTDAFGQVRSQGLLGGGSETYDYDGLGRLIRSGFQYTGTGNTLAADGAALYVRNMSDELVGVRAAAQNRYAWTDLHQDVVGQFGGAATELVGSTTYDPLGQRIGGNGMLGNLGYQSEWTSSSTGRVNMWSRWYNPETGQFDSRDSATLSPTPTSVTANRFVYADDNPLTVTDPTGHWPSWSNTFSSVKSGLKNTWNSTTSALSSAWNSTTSALSSAWNATTNWVSTQWERTKSWASTQWERTKSWASKQWERTKSWAGETYQKARDKVSEGRKWLADKAAEAKRKAQRLAANVKQAGKNMVTKVMSNKLVAKAVNGIADAYKATEKWVQEHKAEIAGFIVGAMVGIGCGALIGWTGVGAVACGALAGAAGSLVTGYMNGERGMDLFKTTALGALGGAIGGLGGIVGGRLASAVGGRLSNFAGSLGGRVLGGALGGGTADGLTQLATTGRINTTQLALATGLGAVAGGFSKGRAGCHSFDPSTRVLMADGSVRPIKDVNVGDEVKATDPVTGTTTAKPVTALHLNRDRDLADVTVSVRAAKGKAATSVTVKTTQNHPFWDKTARKWVTAGALAVGATLLSLGASTAAVADVRNHVGVQNMLDLTVADVHTYYVVAGDTPVLVHNCGGSTNSHLSDLPVHPDINKFNVRAGELVNNRFETHALNPHQMNGGEIAGHGGVRNLTNDELIMPGGPQGDDPIRGARDWGPGDCGCYPASRVYITGGHHRTAEVARRVRAGEMSPDTLIEFVISPP